MTHIPEPWGSPEIDPPYYFPEPLPNYGDPCEEEAA